MKRSVIAAVVACVLVLPPTSTSPWRSAAAASSDDAAVSRVKEDSYYPAIGDPSVDVLHYGLVLDWDDADSVLTGTATLRLRSPRAQESIRLDLNSHLRVDTVTLDGAAVGFSHPDKNLVVESGALAANSRHVLVVTYAGSPEPYDFPGSRGDIPALGWTTRPDGQVWSMQEPYGAFTWYPSHDQPSDKATYDLTVTSRADWVGVANGELRSNTVTSGRRTTHFRLASPTASYLVTIAIGPYRRYTDQGPHGLPVTYWVRPVDRDVLPTLRRTPAMLRWLERVLGRYPFDRAGAVVVPAASAMETQTLVTMGADLKRHGQTFASDLLHEYAHQWYGDTVTPDDWKHLWLNESFAMYVQIRWEVAHGVRSATDWRTSLDLYDQDYRTVGGPPGSYKRSEFGSGSVYYSGARMLFRLRERLGAATFDRLLRAWPQQHRFGSVDRGDWIRFAERVTGSPLGRFVNRWLDAERSPR
ncbi:M1 family metallopeptidase [Nocardioides rubriscoriae]|uniref:M1 family metallopeptidase n=1 Tax=Nocardioides rubriscoriae TaxID=642762 RepID=UPI0011DF5F9C|nr:M1 family metallopeptidase [Nocardioides rubriscoriae]